jgi:uncharacterized protein YtpQ (UPF0354 family)
MSTEALKTFVHPRQAFVLDFPAHWEHRVEENDMTCGFGPYERDNVALWISILPANFDTDELGEKMMQFFTDSLSELGHAANFREERAMYHQTVKADNVKEGEAGHFWMIAGGDLVLYAHSQVPAGEKEIWGPPIDRILNSLRITREKEHSRHKLLVEVLTRLREKHPERDYKLDEHGGISGRQERLSLDNLMREIRETPRRRDELIERYVAAWSPEICRDMGYELWAESERRILPVLKPRDYLSSHTTSRLVSAEWLGDVLICYALQHDKVFRFVSDADCQRWEIDAERLHLAALDNLARLNWPSKMAGTRQEGGGKLILVTTGDSFAASRLLHPDLHDLFRTALGSPFIAAVPDRDTLVLLTNKASLKRRIAKKVKLDHDKSAYSISTKLYLVTPDGIAQPSL